MLSLLDLDNGLPASILADLGIHAEAVKARLRRSLEAAPKLSNQSNQIYPTPRALALLDNAKAESDRLGDEFIGTEHILIAAVKDTQEIRRR